MIRNALLATVASLLAASAAHAANFDFSYTILGTTLSGVLGGTVDGDVFDITSLQALKKNGTNLDVTGWTVGSADTTYLGGSASPSLKLDGSFIDFATSGSSSSLVFAVGDRVSGAVGFNSVIASSSLGGTGSFLHFVPANFSGQLEADTSGAVPEPASWALMLAGFGLVGGAMRSRRRAAISFG